MHFIALSSSRGTTFEGVLQAIEEGALHAKCIGLITDRADRGCIEKAKMFHVPVQIIERANGESREEYERKVEEGIAALGKHDYLCALGWMWILSPAFTTKHKIINVHPALLPKYGGKGMYGDRVHEAVLESGDAQSGITVHLMDGDIDTGPILLQKTCDISPDETLDSLKAKVQTLEKEWYPKVLQMIERGEISL